MSDEKAVVTNDDGAAALRFSVAPNSMLTSPCPLVGISSLFTDSRGEKLFVREMKTKVAPVALVVFFHALGDHTGTPPHAAFGCSSCVSLL